MLELLALVSGGFVAAAKSKAGSLKGTKATKQTSRLTECAATKGDAHEVFEAGGKPLLY